MLILKKQQTEVFSLLALVLCSYHRSCVAQVGTVTCSQSPCKNGGTCQSFLAEVDSMLINSFMCHCPSGTLQPLCDSYVPCSSSSPCMNGGTCPGSISSVGNQCSCLSSFLLPFCTTDCRDTVCENGGTCTHHGICHCYSQFQGAYCEVLSACVSGTCQNGGSCMSLPHGGFKCSCLPGWTDTHCTRPTCSPNPCRNGGSCLLQRNNGLICNCPPGWTGTYCSQPNCSPNPCRNGGSCLLQRSNGLICNCPPGWTGTYCSQPNCSPNPCRNGGSCLLQGNNGLICNCPQGWTGTYCSQPNCSPNPCRNGGSCLLQRNNGLICNCPPGWTGTYCSQPNCSPNPCGTRGACSLSQEGTAFFCNCLSGWTGATCTQPTCSGNVCSNGGTCLLQRNNGLICNCTAGWMGLYCTQPTCSPNPCRNGGLCNLQVSNNFMCSCLSGWTGTYCSQPTCIPNLCTNGGSCTLEGSTNFTCKCGPGWTGKRCTQRHCISNPCMNGGSCIPLDNSFHCACAPGWTGPFCLMDVDECTSTPCLRGGICIDNVNSYMCNCQSGWSGSNCATGCTFSNQACSEVSCHCLRDEVCNYNSGACLRSNCTICNCPAAIESVTLSKVNPSSSVNISCTLIGSTAVLQGLQLRLSREPEGLNVTGITRLTGNRMNSGLYSVQGTFRAHNVTKETNLYCVLFKANDWIGRVSVTDFVYELPTLSAAPIPGNVSNTSVTIIWRAWDPAVDDGDPPVVAYIPYYLRSSSMEWQQGGKVSVGRPFEFRTDNLEVDIEYDFSVAAVREGENGEGPRSPSVTVKTLCNVPNMVASVNVQLTSSNKVNVSWQLHPGEVMCSTGVTTYKVYYRIEGSIDDTSQLAGTVEDVDIRWFIVDDGLLQPGSLYIFFVTVTTDQESDFRESKPIQTLEDTSAPAYLISLIIIPFLVITAIVFIIIRYKRKHFSKDKKATKADDGGDTDYVNAGMADDPEDYIPLEEQSRAVSSSKYEDLNHKPQDGASIPVQYEVAIVPQPQKPEATPRYHTRNVKGVNSGAYEDVGAGSEKRRQLPDVPQSHLSGDEDEDNNYEVPDRLEEYTGVYINIKAKPVQPGPIKAAEFQNFMSRNKEDVVNDIVQQFMALPSGGQYPWSVALKFQNKPRNFFKTILAYDHSRVKLDTNGSDARSDYINASYIKQGKTSFIAAQGPQESTVDDFWKMVWQENVETIVMVTDNIETNKLLCCTYWPKKVHMSEVFDDITVLLMESTSYTTHTIRKLNLLKGDHKTIHTVTQVQVHSWPYGSVPKEPASLISIIKKVKSLQTDGNSSHLLVHCSNGVGATGTFIAVYVLMDTIKKNKDVNVFDFVKNMREDRVDMVQTRIQYLFIFECLLAVIQSTDSQISCDQLKKLGHAATSLKSKKEYKIFQESVIEEQHCEDYIGNSPENQHKNRFKNLIPVDKFRPVLKSEGNTFGTNSYINAIHLADFSGREFIITQTPLSSTVEDFWRLVYDYECATIVMLNNIDGSDETAIQYWPSGGGAHYGLMKVVCTNTANRDLCIQSQFEVVHKKVGEKSVSVDHFAFCGWSGNQPDVSKLRQFIRYTGNKNGPVLVHCINGVGLSAVYVIVKTESERLDQEGSADVFECLNKLRKICPYAIQSQEEYTLCYKLLKDHLDNPEEYAVVY